MPAKGPTRFEAGTPPIAEAAGLGAAVLYLEGLGMDNVHEHERSPHRERTGAPRSRVRRKDPGDRTHLHASSEAA